MFKATVSGYCSGDPEVRYTSEGKPIITFSLPINSRRKNRDGDYEDHTDWVRVRAMRGADYLQKTLSKGSKVTVIGDLQIGTYQTKDNETRVSLDIPFPDVVEVSAAPRANVDEHENQERAPSQQRSRTAVADKDDSALDLADLPF